MMRTGKHVTDELAAYIGGELDSESAVRVAAHVLSCRRCHDAAESVRSAARAAGTLRRVPAPDGLFDEIEARLDRSSGHGVVDARETLEQNRWPMAAWMALAMAGVAIFSVIVWTVVNTPPTAFEVTTLEGTARVERRTTKGRDMISAGEWLETDASSRARIRVADIGQVEVGPDSRIGLVTTGPNEHRLSLERGSMRAVVMAPPRLFLVDTPTATAVDYGCIYTLVVEDSSRSILRVASGRVALERNGRDVMVPEGAMCEARAGLGVGTPVYEDANDALRDAVRRFDFEGGGSGALTTILAQARPRDAITLENIVDRVSIGERSRVVEKLRTLSGR
jgi:hypothetical protein